MNVANANTFAEVSTPFLHARWFMFKHKTNDSALFNVNIAFFFVTFTYARVIFLSQLSYMSLISFYTNYFIVCTLYLIILFIGS